MNGTWKGSFASQTPFSDRSFHHFRHKICALSFSSPDIFSLEQEKVKLTLYVKFTIQNVKDKVEHFLDSDYIYLTKCNYKT